MSEKSIDLLNDFGLQMLLEGDGLEVDYFLARAVRTIDQLFGDGYAKANPALVGTYLQAAVTMRTSNGEGTVESAAELIAGSISELAEAVDSLAQQSDLLDAAQMRASIGAEAVESAAERIAESISELAEAVDSLARQSDKEGPQLRAYLVDDVHVVAAYSPEEAITVLQRHFFGQSYLITPDDVVEIVGMQMDTPIANKDGSLGPTIRQRLSNLDAPCYLFS
ncbi:hypothetical protein [Gulbenkiania mobilis]|uniref:hypothetical protein n=1 Tax=Gulbenkiania mobilis TaxID=397457 RepID=UPI0006BBC046|nr:hypothetical protein [Gulbenkiania mobilis]